tara:strand:+ start:946 stop:1317 length:372 start_codon:yes stop_codon:yes gene_type:complete
LDSIFILETGAIFGEVVNGVLGIGIVVAVTPWFRPRKTAKSLITRMWDFCALSPIPRIRISSIIRWRSGVTLSSVMETSCLMIEKIPVVRQVCQIAKCAAFWASRAIGGKHQCREAASSSGRK